jgi:hypothetical protein
VALRPAVEETTETQLYERHAGRVFAYCFARVGSRNVAEWAVTATFDRARDALSNGGLSEPELDWLLRTADKFCSPRLRLRSGALDASGALVLADWDGLTFDEIAARLEASREQLDRARGELSPWRRVLGVLNLGPLVAWAKGALTGATTVNAVAAALAFTGAVVVVGTPIADRLHDAVAPGHQSPAPARSEHGASAPVSSSQGRAGRPAAVPASGAQASPVRAKGPGPSPGASPLASAPVQAGAQPSSTPSGTAGQPGATTTGAAPPASSPAAPAVLVPTGPSAPGAEIPTTSEPAPTVPTATAPAPLPAPPPVPDTSSLPVPTDETPTVPAPPDLGQVDVPSVPAAPSAPSTPDVPTAPTLP